MSTKSGTIKRHRFHGDPMRFEVIADYIVNRFGKDVMYVADVAGGQGMLVRVLNKAGYTAEVIDPRGWTLVGVQGRKAEYSATMASYYDLVVGLHPDEATREVVESAKEHPTLVIPCCNFWDRSRKLGQDALLDEIEKYYVFNSIKYERITFDFEGPKNLGFVTG